MQIKFCKNELKHNIQKQEIMKVTFDSNTWRQIASPETFPGDPDIVAIRKIRQTIIDGKIIPCLSETIFTLEGIQRKDRKQFLSDYKAKIDFKETENDDGSIGLNISIGPDIKAHPRNNPFLTKHLTDALQIGFKILKCPRIAGITNPDIDKYFLEQSSDELKEKLEILGKLLQEIEKKGVGIKVIKVIGDKYKGTAPNWHVGIRLAPDSVSNDISKAMAEWADGDSVASHIAYKNDYFCTRDLAKKSGPQSIFSSLNRQWLETDYKVIFVDPNELLSKI